MDNKSDDKTEISNNKKSALFSHKKKKELNYPIRRWNVRIFIGIIVSSITYCVYYIQANGPLNIVEHGVEIKKTKETKESFEITKVGFSKDHYRKVTADPRNKKRSKKLYQKECRSCHGANGEGGIGPNLTDKYWIHGTGSLADIYKVLDEGVIDKGMAAWGQNLGKEKVLSILSYITQLQGTRPHNPKAPQGKEYK